MLVLRSVSGFLPPQAECHGGSGRCAKRDRTRLRNIFLAENKCSHGLTQVEKVKSRVEPMAVIHGRQAERHRLHIAGRHRERRWACWDKTKRAAEIERRGWIGELGRIDQELQILNLVILHFFVVVQQGKDRIADNLVRWIEFGVTNRQTGIVAFVAEPRSPELLFCRAEPR